MVSQAWGGGRWPQLDDEGDGYVSAGGVVRCAQVASTAPLMDKGNVSPGLGPAFKASCRYAVPWVVTASGVYSALNSYYAGIDWSGDEGPSYLECTLSTGNVSTSVIVDLPPVGGAWQLPPAQTCEVRALVSRALALVPDDLAWNITAARGETSYPTLATYTTRPQDHVVGNDDTRYYVPPWARTAKVMAPLPATAATIDHCTGGVRVLATVTAPTAAGPLPLHPSATFLRIEPTTATVAGVRIQFGVQVG